MKCQCGIANLEKMARKGITEKEFLDKDPGLAEGGGEGDGVTSLTLPTKL